MNQRTRRKLEKLAKKVRAFDETVRELQQEMADLAGEERDKADNMMEGNLAESEMAASLEDSAQEMEDVDGMFDFVLDALEEAAAAIEDRAAV